MITILISVIMGASPGCFLEVSVSEELEGVARYNFNISGTFFRFNGGSTYRAIRTNGTFDKWNHLFRSCGGST